MASELFDFAFDFGLTFFEPSPQKKDVTTGGLTEEEYLKGNVDFYDQTLGQTLGTGINVRFKDEDEDEDKDKDVDISRVGGGDDKSPMSFAEMESVFDKDQISTKNIYDVNVGTYGEALSKAGFADKTPFNFFGQDIYTASIPKTKEEVKQGLEKFISKESLVNQVVKTGARVMGMNPLITGPALGFANGTTVNDPLGNPSFRPNHFALGGIHDINMSIQYDNINAIQASLRDPKSDLRGFASYINGQLVTRPPKGFNYSGTGAIGLDQQTLQRIDALSKGIVPDTYDYKTETGTTGTPTGKGGMYDSRGNYHDINGSAPIGPRSASEAIGKSSGLGTAKIEEILAEVRADEKKNLNEEIAKAQAENFEAVQKAQQETVQERIQEDPSVTSIPTYTSPTYSYEYYTGGDDSNQSDDTATSGEDTSQDMGFSTRYGGQIGEGMQEGGPAGFIGGPPEKYDDQTTIADDIPLEVKEGTFVINAPAVEYAGSDDIADMLRKAYEKAGESIDKSGQTTTIPSREQIDIMISRGEVVVPPKIAKIIGYDRLEKINNRGKKEVARRKRAGDKERPQARQANQGGTISSGFIDYDALERRYGTRNIDQVIQKATADVFGVREQGEKAQKIAYNFAKQNKFKDNDKSEDTLRHIIGGGLMADKKLGFAVYNLKENPYVNMIYGGLKGQGFTLPTGKAKQEGEIDLNNNEFGKALRQKYPNEKEFIKQAKRYLMDLRAGKEVKPVNGFRPMMSLGFIQREN